ncbi:M3 family metallopeptidase [Synechococcus sp. HB1133]|uniref:M3 family metallopeptidase n=1 Tax=unclassified Synechococcus TaxID=2626047 RepID=UPI001407EB51|nr:MULTISPECIES: M3 family metallopeptidase [unclassified Synechococcus]MCB4395128.1 M3 family metallopeptidase [Synechococcus sp. PH41509]MCB4422028.1 M3 family metallopeptidase [Synechococcus sp. HB1133]MCB4430024.1 M3 family metallopeptidase [Synechococcus sp. HBA1120]NHI80971.1 M3 family peptidase [Synechococcus sp. HB1133]
MTPSISPLLRGKGLPEFQAISPELVSQDIPVLLEQLDRAFSELEKSLESALAGQSRLSWDAVMQPLQAIGERLRWSWGVVSHLNGVCNSPELRDAHAAQQPDVVRLSNRLGQSQILHRALESLQSGPADPLNATQQRILKSELLSMQQRGVGLSGEEKAAFNRTSERLAALSTQFGNHVLDATQQWTLKLTQPNEVEGLPQRALEALAAAAREAGDADASAEAGPWLLGLDMPRYLPFLTHAKNRALREQAYRAHVGRASEGELDNRALIEEILTLRREQASRLGYAHWADLSLSAKMADDVPAVEALLEELRAAAYPAAEQELRDLQSIARDQQAPEADDLAPWDVAYWSERLRQSRFDLDQEALRPWFPLPKVLDGLFSLCSRLFDVEIVGADGEAPIWNDDVRFFRVKRSDGTPIAGFYLDPYSRPASKRGGAWMDECLGLKKQPDGSMVLPVAYLICNQTPPVGDTPSLMSFEEVETLFHEFGHGLQHMLTTVEEPEAAGISNVEWDAVELPSQFMENWCLDHATLMGMARHWQTGEPLPEAEFNKLRSSRTFNAGLATLRQVHFALSDLRLHSKWTPELGVTPDALRREIAATTTVMAPIPEDQFLCSFGHIFAGGYSAGYYSYKWAEVLSADAFSAFEEVGLDHEDRVRETGARFRDTVLSLGGSRSPSEVFEAFRGRPASTEALIRHSGLVAAA